MLVFRSAAIPLAAVLTVGFFATAQAVEGELTALEKRVVAEVMQLGYPEEVGTALVVLAGGWRTGDGTPALASLKSALEAARRDIMAATMEEKRVKLATAEADIAMELALTILHEVKHDYREGAALLPDVVESKPASSFGSAQLVYVLGRAIELSPQTISVTYPLPGRQLVRQAHTACIVHLSDGETMMVDVSFGPIVSEPFEMDDVYEKVDGVLELRDADNPLGVHRRIRLLDENGPRAMVYVVRGIAETTAGRYAQAIELHSKSQSYDPGNPVSFLNRALAQARLDRDTNALIDLGKAISFDPQYADAVLAIGYVYHCRGESDRAIEHYTKAIELNAHYSWAYVKRGACHAELGDDEEAIADLRRALELDANLKEEVVQVIDEYDLDLNVDEVLETTQEEGDR